MKKKIDLIVGTRPNFIKCAPLFRELAEAGFDARIIHTGQHYNENMSDIFFRDLDMKKAYRNLNVGSMSHGRQTGRIIEEYENCLLNDRPDMTVVFGDVNSTAAAVIAAVKLHLTTAHVEAGLRSFDRRMPEEINRLVTDSIADILFAPSADAVTNLAAEGRKKRDIFLVGNIMIDTLKANIKRIEEYPVEKEFQVREGKYLLTTLHRPSNVDEPSRFREVVRFLNRIAEHHDIIFPCHPRTVKNMETFGLRSGLSKRIRIVEPVSYLQSLALAGSSYAVVTDSGGIQEETTYLNIPCYTLRENTERPVTITEGTNMLMEPTLENAERIIEERGKRVKKPPKYWDGKTSKRIVRRISAVLK